jgi:hypothetical protein
MTPIDMWCASCKQPRALRCVNKHGRPTPFHKARIEAADAANAKARAKHEAETNAKAEHVTFVANETIADVIRSNDADDQIDAIIWGINFARTHMGVDQSVIDRRLAEMIYEAEIADGMMP